MCSRSHVSGERRHAVAARIELRRQGIQVVGVHPGPDDTDMAAAFELEKIPPATVAASALDALEADEPGPVVDDYSRAVKADRR